MTTITWKCHTHISLMEPRGRDTEHRQPHDYNNLEVPHSHISHEPARMRHRTQTATWLQLPEKATLTYLSRTREDETQNTGSHTTTITLKCNTHISLTKPRGGDKEQREPHDCNNLEVPHSHITHWTTRMRHRTQTATWLQLPGKATLTYHSRTREDETQNTGSHTTTITWKCHTHISLTEPQGWDT